MCMFNVSVCMFRASLVIAGYHLYVWCILKQIKASVCMFSVSVCMFSASLVIVGHQFVCLVHR